MRGENVRRTFFKKSQNDRTDERTDERIGERRAERRICVPCKILLIMLYL